MDVRAGCPFRNACFFQDLEGLTEVFGRMSAGISGQILPLCAEFSFLNISAVKMLHQMCPWAGADTVQLQHWFLRGAIILIVVLTYSQKTTDVWNKDVWDFQVFSQTFLELRFSLGNEGKAGKNLNSQTWPGTPRRPSPKHLQPPDLHYRT